MERRRIILIGVVAAVLLIGLVIGLGARKPKGPDCGLIARAQTQSGRPVAALAPLLGDDAKGGQADKVKNAMSALIDVARVPSPIPDFSKSSVPDAVKQAEAASQIWLKCGATAVVWGSVEHEGDQVIDDKKDKGKKPATRPVYGILLWVTSGAETTVQIARTRDGREAGEAAFKAWSEKSGALSSPSAPATEENPRESPPKAPISGEGKP